MNLKAKISLAVSFLLVLTITSLGHLFLNYFEREIKKDTSAHQFVLVSRLASNIDERLHFAQQGLVAAAKAFPRDFSLAQSTLEGQKDGLIFFNNSVALMAPDGRLLACVPDEPAMFQKNFSGRRYFQQTMETGKPFISQPFTSLERHGHPIIMMTAPLLDAAGKIEALLVGSVDLTQKNFLDFIATSKVGNNGYLYLFARDRTMIIHPDPSRIMQQDVPPGANRLLDQAVEGFEGSGETVNSRGIPMLASFKPLRNVDWIISAATPLGNAYASVRQARNFLLSAVSLAALLAVASTWSLMHALMVPLARFTTHVKTFHKKTGQQRQFPVRRNDEVGVLAQAFNRMVTEAEREEAAVRRSEALLSEAQRMARIGNWECDPVSGHIYWSDEMHRITGLGREVLPRTRKDFLSLVHPEDQDRIKTAMREALAGRKPFVQEHRFLHSDGSVRMVHSRAAVSFDENKRPARIFGTVQDITAARKTEEELRASRRRFLVAFNANPDGIAITRQYDGRILEVNAAMLQMLGRKRTDVVGRTTLDAGLWANPAERTIMLSLLRQHDRVNNIETRLRRADGTTFPTFLSASLIDYNGEACLLSVVRDVTEFKRMEDELRQSREELQNQHIQLQTLFNEMTDKNQELETAYGNLQRAHTQLVHQEKMASLGQLAAGVAHEINNPIGFINSNLGTLEKYLDRLIEFIQEQSRALETEETCEKRIQEQRRVLRIDAIVQDIPELIHESLEGTQRVKKIVQDLKSFSRLDQETPCPFDLGECLESAVNMAWNEIKYKANVERNLTSTARTTGYPGQLGQVFLNLLVNAAQAIEKKGAIKISTFDQDKWVVIEIADTGSGIETEDLTRIFDPFFTTKDVGQGTGLGLSIAYDIVQKHGGDIAVTSEGEGTCFRIKLPATQGEENDHG